MQNLSNCPVCDASTFQKEFTSTDYTVTKEKFNIVSCTNCNFFFTNPRPEQSAIGKYYESEDYISHSNAKKGIINSIYQFVRSYSLSKKVNLINLLSKAENKAESKSGINSGSSSGSKKGEILDIGSGTGEFLAKAVENGWSGIGVEPNMKARAQAIANHNLNIYTEEDVHTLKKSHFDVITMWHVLEHVHSLNERVEEIFNLLKPGGISIIAVPNHLSYDAQKYKEDWAAYDVPRHLYHFDPNSIKKLFKKHNFSHVQSFPMKFDSFYVSMLSEKNIAGKNQFLTSFITGGISNLKTKNNPEKYSSVIYVFKKPD